MAWRAGFKCAPPTLTETAQYIYQEFIFSIYLVSYTDLCTQCDDVWPFTVEGINDEPHKESDLTTLMQKKTKKVCFLSASVQDSFMTNLTVLMIFFKLRIRSVGNTVVSSG